MGIVFRQGVLNTGIIFAGILIGFLNEFILLRNFLEQDQIGLIKLLLQVSALFAQFGALGGVNTLLRYFPYFRNRETQHGGVLFGFLAIGAAGFGLVALFLQVFQGATTARFAANAPLFTEYFYLLYPLILFTLNFYLLEAYAKSNYRTVASAFLREIILRIFITACVTAYIWNWIDIHEFYLLFTAANCLVTVLLAGWIILQGDWLIRPSAAFFRGPQFREMIGFGLLSLVSNFSALLYTSIDTIMIGARIGLAAVAIYATGSFLSSVIMAPGRSLIRIASPLVADHWKKEDMVAMDKLYRQVSINSLIAGSWLFLAIYAGTGAIFELIPPSFAPAIPVFLLLGIARVYDMATGINGTILMTSRYYQYVAIGNVLTGVTAVATNALLIPRLGIPGAALATLITILLTNSLRVWFVWRRFGLQPFGWNALWTVLAAAATGGLQYLLFVRWGGTGNVWLDAFLGILLVSAMFMGISLRLKLSPDLDERVQKSWKRWGPG